MVFSHVEIPIVAVMSYAFLSRPLTRTQWIAIVLLLDGVMASEISLCHARENRSCDAPADYPVAALALVLLGALLAAMAGISVEYMYKEEYRTSIHLQNAQLYAFGVVANSAVVLARDMEGLKAGGALDGFDSQAWFVVVTLAMFGLVTSLVVKHLSNIAKVGRSAAREGGGGRLLVYSCVDGSRRRLLLCSCVIIGCKVWVLTQSARKYSRSVFKRSPSAIRSAHTPWVEVRCTLR